MKTKAVITTIAAFFSLFLLGYFFAKPVSAKFCSLRANYCTQDDGYGDCKDRNICSEWVNDWEDCNTVLQNKCPQYYPLPQPDGWDECQVDSECPDAPCGYDADEQCLAPGACNGAGCYTTGRPCSIGSWVCCVCSQPADTPTPGPTSTPGVSTPTPTPGVGFPTATPLPPGACNATIITVSPSSPASPGTNVTYQGRVLAGWAIWMGHLSPGSADWVQDLRGSLCTDCTETATFRALGEGTHFLTVLGYKNDGNTDPDCSDWKTFETTLSPTIPPTIPPTPTPTNTPTPTPTRPPLNPAPICSGLNASPDTLDPSEYSKIKVTASDSGNENVFAQNWNDAGCGSFPAVKRVTIRALGDSSILAIPPGDAKMELWVNGEKTLLGSGRYEWDVPETGWQNYIYDFASNTQVDDLAVTFINDGGWGAGDDRNLYIDKITLTLGDNSTVILEAEERDTAGALMTIIDRAVAGSSYFDGNQPPPNEGVRTIRGVVGRILGWNSSLRFPKVWQAPSPVAPPGITCNVSSEVRDKVGQIDGCGSVSINVNSNQGTIQGYVFDDGNNNGCLNGGEGRVDGAVVKAVDSGLTYTDTSGPNGTYSFNNILSTGYTLSIGTLPAGFLGVSGWDDNDSCPEISTSATHGVFLPGGATLTRNIGLSRNPNPWFQTKEGDVHGNTTVTETVPAGQYFMDGIPPSGGVLTMVNSEGISGNINRNGWVDDSYDLIDSGFISYDTLWEKHKSEVTTITRFTDLNQGSGQFRIANNVTITDGNVDELGSNPTLIFIGGDGGVDYKLEIRAEDIEDKNVIFIVSGDVEIESNVKTIEAAIIFDGQFITESPGASTQDLLTIKGMVVSTGVNPLAGGQKYFDLRRKRDDNTDPAELFQYDPSYLLGFADLLGESKSTWREVAP